MTKRSCIALFTIAMAACSDGGTGPSETTPEFTAGQATFMPWQVAVLTLNGPAPSADVQGSIGGEPVTLMPAGDSAVAFMMPEVGGTQTLTFSVGSRTYSGSLAVISAPTIVDAQQYLETFAADAESGIAAVEAEFAEQGVTDARAVMLLDIARDSLVTFRARMAELTPDQAQQAARMLQANRLATQSSQQLAMAAGIVHATAYGEIPDVCSGLHPALKQYKCTWNQFILAMADATIGLAGGGLALKVLAPTPWFALFVGGALIIDGAIDAARAVGIGGDLLHIHLMIAAEIAKSTGELVWNGGTQYFRAHIYDPDAIPDMYSFAMSGMRAPPASMTSFTNGGATSFVFAPQVRPVQSADRALGLDWLARGIALVHRYNSLVARFGTDFQLQFAPPTTDYTAYVPHTEIDVEVVQNSNVRVRRVSGSGSRVDVTFETDAATVQDFTYDIVYSSEVYPDLRVRYEAKLHPPSYRLGSVRDTTLLGDTIRIYGRMQNMFFLMHSDGSLPDGSFHLINQTEPPSGIHFTLNDNGGHLVYLNGAITVPSVTVDTFDIRIAQLYPAPAQPLLDATIILHDSAGTYENVVAGTWTRRTYLNDGEYLDQSNVLRFDAGGTGMHVSRTEYGSDTSTTTVVNIPLEWQISVTLEDGRPVHSLRYVLNSSIYTARLAYPVTAFTRQGTYFNSPTLEVYSRN